MARPWKPARRCSACFYPNDSDANYCQACGALTKPRRSAARVPPLDQTAIQGRFDEFQSVFRSKPYERRKSALEQLGRYCISYAFREGFPKSSFWDSYPVSHPDNLQAAVWIMFCCVFSITVLTFRFCLGLGWAGVFWVMETKDVWRSDSLVFSFFSVPYSGLGSIKCGTEAASFHNLVLRDGVIGVQWGYFTDKNKNIWSRIANFEVNVE